MSLLRAREAVMRRFRPGLRQRGVTEQQWRILRALAAGAPLEVTALVSATCMLAPSVSRILPELEARHLVIRRRVEGDRRRVVVALAPDGLRMIARHGPDSEEVYDDIARRYGRARLARLFALLRELESVLDEPTASGPRAALRRRSAKSS
jgi:homoprotocatechuate degradation regulator HpaR